MRIGYRRFSGPVGVTQQESGTRGLWWGKRLALLRLLQARGHQVVPMTRPTKHSVGVWKPTYDPTAARIELLLIEFGGTNMQFYGEDIQQTVDILRRHNGIILYLNDDPDLMFPWSLLPQENWTRWSMWFNAKHPELAGTPQDAVVHDAPFGAMIPCNPPDEKYLDLGNQHLVYIGRADGRKKVFEALLSARVPFKVYGKNSEWDSLPISLAGEPPTQPHRAVFYSHQMGALAVADNKHKRLGWRTGRAYHAIAAGCPALVEADHSGLEGMVAFHAGEQAYAICQRWLDPRLRRADWELECSVVQKDRQSLESLLSREGL